MAPIEARRNHRVVRQLLGRHSGRGDQHAGAGADADIAGGADIEAKAPELAVAFDDCLAGRRLGDAHFSNSLDHLGHATVYPNGT